ncbi:LON peptidase substrate-binding domain-containing protein [Salinispira pacifica]|uniref:Uncharacterized protein, similar to the N-terminal domain of Lon protease n=1 Tax=Salinispira pacifica TaxID=1307761 RepID=V5WJL4_9SPIO|nr:LON peptidase substrate-binding domain-containing protein [Salinispira pacifica]AHC15963.1 Uncharacterized protein, similar to the N-terminal domain of Lon protease [Salinispira pacifica]
MKKIIPIFPLGVVLLPGMQLPLHIFEERYRLMVSHCLKQDEPFGIVYYDGSSFKSTGCSGKITNVLKEYEDGRKDIIIQGSDRFTLEEVDDSGEYLTAEVKYFSDCSTSASSRELERMKTEAVEAVIKLASLNNRELDRKYLMSLNPVDFSFLISASDMMNLEDKQENLETSSTANRLQSIITTAKRVIMRSEAHHQLLKILGDNSDIRHIFN